MNRPVIHIYHWTRVYSLVRAMAARAQSMSIIPKEIIKAASDGCPCAVHTHNISEIVRSDNFKTVKRRPVQLPGGKAASGRLQFL